jgi:hypothetical protein
VHRDKGRYEDLAQVLDRPDELSGESRMDTVVGRRIERDSGRGFRLLRYLLLFT